MNNPFQQLKIYAVGLLMAICMINTASAQVPDWLDDLNQEIDLLANNAADCRAYIADVQAEIDALIKNTPPPITGTPTEKKIRDLQRTRFAAKCFLKKTEKELSRLKTIRDVLKKRFGQSAGNSHLQTEIKKAEQKVDKVEKDIQQNEAAKQKAIDTVNDALNEHK